MSAPRTTSCIAWLGCAAAIPLGGEVAQATHPGGNGRISFVSDTWRVPSSCSPSVPHGCEPEQASSRFETVLPNGRHRRALAVAGWDGAAVSPPTWSPNGKRLALTMAGHLATVRGDGTGLRRLPLLTLQDLEPAWSPGGRRIAFVGNRRCLGCQWLYITRRDGSGLTRVVAHGTSSPAWSSRGVIAFVNHDDSSGISNDIEDGLYTVHPDGSHLRRVFGSDLGPGEQPDWSPDGTTIAFAAASRQFPDAHAIYTIKADGRGLRRLTRFATGASDPTWSPDGRYIAFLHDDDVFLMRASGRAIRRVVDTPRRDPADRAWTVLGGLSWQPLPHRAAR